MANTENTVMPALEGYFPNENFVDETLSRAGAAADAKEVGDRLQKMDTAFDQRMTDMDEAFDQRMTNMDEAFDRQMDALESNIDNRLESMNEDIEKIENVVDEKAEAYLGQISESTANSLAQFKETSSEKLEQMEEKGKEVLKTLPDDYLELEERVGQLSKEIDDVIENDLLREVECPATWSVGNWDSNTGTAGTNKKRIKTDSNTTIADLEYVIKSESGVLFFPVFYDAESNCVPLVNNPYIDVCNIAKYAPVGAVKFRLVARTEPETTLTDLVDDTAAKVHFYKYNTVKQYQGSSNVGKVLAVNENGFVEPKDMSAYVEYIKATTKNIRYVVSPNLCNPAEIKKGRMETDGTITEVVGNSHTGLISVHEGDSVGIYRNTGGVTASIYGVRVTAFDKNKNALPDKGIGSASKAGYKVPEGVCYVVYSFDAIYTPMVAIDYSDGGLFVDYFAPHYSYGDDFLTDKTKELIQNLPLHGKTIVNFGDSIFAKRSAPTDISSYIAQLTGATVHNCAFSGCRMAEIGESYESTNAFSMIALTDAIISGDFSRQEAVVGETTEDETSLKRQHLTNLENIDFTKVDIVTIAYGTNDWTSGVGLTSYGNALSYAIEKILTTYPTVQIFVCLPTFRWKASEETESGYVDTDGDEWTNSITGLKLRDFIEKARTISESYRVQVIDNYYGLGLNRFNTYLSSDWKTFYTDNTHPNARGSKLIAEHIVNELY